MPRGTAWPSYAARRPCPSSPKRVGRLSTMTDRYFRASGNSTAESAIVTRLLGADDLEVLVDEDVVRPVDADVVDVVVAVAQLHNTVYDAPRVGG
jgi:hypothetical protein